MLECIVSNLHDITVNVVAGLVIWLITKKIPSFKRWLHNHKRRNIKIKITLPATEEKFDYINIIIKKGA